MARNAIRTASVSLDIINRLIGLFGTVANAHRQLGLETLVPYPNFYRAMHFHPVTPEHRDEIEGAWARWIYLYLRPEVPVTDELKLTPFNRDETPDWHPDATETAQAAR